MKGKYITTQDHSCMYVRRQKASEACSLIQKNTRSTTEAQQLSHPVR